MILVYCSELLWNLDKSRARKFSTNLAIFFGFSRYIKTFESANNQSSYSDRLKRLLIEPLTSADPIAFFGYLIFKNC